MLTDKPKKDFESSQEYVMRMYYETYKNFDFVKEADERKYKWDGKIEQGYGRPDIAGNIKFECAGKKYKLIRDLGYWKDKHNKTLTHIGEVMDLETNGKSLANIDTPYFKLHTLDEPSRVFN